MFSRLVGIVVDRHLCGYSIPTWVMGMGICGYGSGYGHDVPIPIPIPTGGFGSCTHGYVVYLLIHYIYTVHMYLIHSYYIFLCTLY